MPKLNKINPSDIIDTLHIVEVSEETGNVVEYTKSVYSAEAKEKMEENKNIILSQKELHVYLKEEYGNFFFYFYNKLDTYDIKPQYKLRFLYLASHLDYNNGNMIIRGEHNMKIRLNKETMRDILKLKDTEFRKTVKALTDCGLLIKDGKHYDLNTDCSVKGEVPKNKKDYTRVFIKTIRNLYDKCDPISHKQLYYIFKILPLVNLQFNIPCRNTECETIRDIHPLTMTEICNEIGYNSTHASRLWKELRGFKVDDNYVLCKHSIDDKEYLAINPMVYYAGTRIDNVKYLIGIFDMVK
ncbi:MAG: hypothetical protein ACRC1P_10875 [Cellulosilyticaceae bacterium]